MIQATVAKKTKNKKKQREITSTACSTTPKGIYGQPRTPYTPKYR